MPKLNVESATAIDITMEICGVLMKNGADISRIEAAARELCTIFGIRQTGILVIPSFITITYIDDQLKKQTSSYRNAESGTNLSKIEGACNLISKIRANSLPVKDICIEINRLKSKKDDTWYKRLATYIGVATTFTIIFFGANVMELRFIEILFHVVSAAACSIVIYKSDEIIAQARISDIFAKIVSAILLVITLYVCERVISLLGDWEFYSVYVLMGNIMLIVPGIKFTNGIKDLFNGDVASATIHVVEAVFATIGIVLGVILMQNALSYELTTVVNSVELAEAPLWYLWVSVVITGFGTLCFALYFRIDLQHVWLSFFAGALTWLVYIVCVEILSTVVPDSAPNADGNMLFASVFIPNFCAALFAAIISECIAHKKNIPSMIFVFPAIVSLIPGGSLYKALDSIINVSSLFKVSMITETLYAAGGISCGVLVIAAIGRIWFSLVDAVDIKSAKETNQMEARERCILLYDEANRLYSIGRRHIKYDAIKAFDFFLAAHDSYDSAIYELKKIKNGSALQCKDSNLEYDVYLAAGINLFWMYKCAVSIKMPEDEQKKYLKNALDQYNKAQDAATGASVSATSPIDIAQKKCLLENWMAVMKINMARFEKDDSEWEKCVVDAEQLLESAMVNNASYANVYLNTAEVAFTRLAKALGIVYDKPISCAIPPTLLNSIEKKEIKQLFYKIEENLQKAMLWKPQMINAYYKMAQLYTYKIFYHTKCLHQSLDSTKKLQREAEKWLMNASLREQHNSGYLFICREYYELIDFTKAVMVNKVIFTIDTLSANKWSQDNHL